MFVYFLITKELVWRRPERAETSQAVISMKLYNWTCDCISCIYLAGNESSYIMLIYFRLQVLTIIPQSSREPQKHSKDTTAWACVWLAVPALQVPNAIRYDLQPPSALDVHSEQRGPLLTGKSRNIDAAGVTTMSTNTNSIHIDLGLGITLATSTVSGKWCTRRTLLHPSSQNIQSFFTTVATSIHTSTVQQLWSTTTDQPNIRAELNRYKKRQTMDRPIHNTRQYYAYRIPRFLPSFPMFKSLKHTRHNAEIYQKLLQALIWYITLHENLFFRSVESFNKCFCKQMVHGQKWYSSSYICVCGQVNLALGLRTVHCRCVWKGGLQAFSSSALKSDHCHTIYALLPRKCSSTKYTTQKTWHIPESQYIWHWEWISWSHSVPFTEPEGSRHNWRAH